MENRTSDIPRSVGWICTSPLQFATAKAMLDVRITDPLAERDYDNVYLGRIGPVNVVIGHIPLSHSTSIPIVVQHMMTSLKNIKSILVMGVINGLTDPDINPGDLIINSRIQQDEDYSESLPAERSLSQQAATLQREAGDDGRWLSGNFPTVVSPTLDPLTSSQPLNNPTSKSPRLNYRTLGQDNQNIPKEIIVPEDYNSITRVIENLIIDVVTILTAGRYTDSNNRTEEYAAALLAASFAKELIQSLSNGLTNSISSLTGTESVIPPNLEIEVPSFESQQFPRHGDSVLLVIPTANKSKGKLLEDGFKKQKPEDVVLHSISLPFDSGVGEQPYNEAGVLGAHTRISSVLHQLDSPGYQELLRSKGIGTVVIASIENYIQLDNVERPTDYGVVVIHNASTGDTTAGLSRGVTVPPAYVNRARRFGFEGNPNYGRVTVGQILAANVPGLDKADFHSVLAGHSRYDLLSEAIGHLTIPW